MTSIIHIFTFFEHVLFRHPNTRAHYRVRSCFFIILFLLGIAHWVGFFNAGDLSLVAYDWVKEDAYLNTLREALTSGVIPWRWSEPFYHGTQNFLANPEIILTPDIVLLRWIPNSIFVIIHIILLYSVGFFGCLLITRKLNASFVAFLIFWLVFNFNGYVIAHLAVGHLQWTGYFLLPFFFIILSTFVRESQSASSIVTTPALGMGLLLGVLFLNGSFHIAVWCSMFMTIALLWRWSMFLNVVTAIIIGGLLGLGRLLPAALLFPEKKDFISGYPSFGTVLDAFTSLRRHDFGGSGGIFGTLGWWEYDIYIGFVAFIILVICLAVALKRSKVAGQLPLFAAAGVFLLLSFGNVYALIATSSFPFAGIERVSSRFIVMPFMLFLITAMKGIDELFCSWPTSSKRAVLIGIPFVAYELVLHSLYWRVDFLERSFQQKTKPVLSLVPNSDQIYTLSVYAGWSASLISLSWVVALLFRNRKAFTYIIQSFGSQSFGSDHENSR